MGPREGSWWNFLCVIRILFRWLYLWWHCSSKRWTYPWLREKCEQDFLHNSESKNPWGKNIIGYFRRNSILLLARLLTKPSGSIMNEIRLSQNIPWFSDNSHGDIDYNIGYYDYPQYFWVIIMIYFISIILWAEYQLCMIYHNIFVLTFEDSGDMVQRDFMHI